MLEPKGKPELELDLVLPKGLARAEAGTRTGEHAGATAEFKLEHVKSVEPTIEGDQVPEMGTGMELRLNLESRLTRWRSPNWCQS